MSVLRRCNNWIGQPARDASMVMLLPSFVMLFLAGLDTYLIGLSNPVPMKFAFSTSLFVTVLWDLKEIKGRQAIVMVLGTAIIFATSSWLAQEYRQWYLQILEEVKSVQEATELVGKEYVQAADNPAVGMGACFAMALATVRLPFRRVIIKALNSVFIVNGALPACPECGRRIDQR